jgi:hypothetical protein
MAMLKDRELYGDLQEGVYRGVKWSIKANSYYPHSPRNHPLNTPENTTFNWCGYVDLERPPTPEDIACMETYKECTYEQGNVMGFDCGHFGDYPFWSDLSATYKDLAHVKRQLYAIIDSLVRTRERIIRQRIALLACFRKRRWPCDIVQAITHNMLEAEPE